MREDAKIIAKKIFSLIQVETGSITDFQEVSVPIVDNKEERMEVDSAHVQSPMEAVAEGLYAKIMIGGLW